MLAENSAEISSKDELDDLRVQLVGSTGASQPLSGAASCLDEQ
ncbi:MAG: hypothetical protein AB8B36_01895 [Prochlorococcus sp.]